MSSIAIVLPAHDEAPTVADTIREFHSAIPEAAIYVINNNSKDNTAKVASEALSRCSCEGGVLDEPRQGKGNAIRRAFMSIDADIYVLADADTTYPASRARDLVSPILEGRADMVVGDRHSDGGYARENERPLHGMGNKLVQWLVNVLFRSRLVDIMSGYRALSRTFVKNYPILVEGFEIETDMTLHALHKRFRVMEIPIAYRKRPAGSISKLNTLFDGAKVIFTIAQILRYYRPILFFSGVALFFMVTGLLAAIPVFDDWITSRYIKHVPLAILASALEIVAVMAASVGLVLDSVVHQNRLEYERNLLAEGKAATAPKVQS